MPLPQPCNVKWCVCYAAAPSVFCVIHERYPEQRTQRTPSEQVDVDEEDEDFQDYDEC